MIKIPCYFSYVAEAVYLGKVVAMDATN